MRESCFQPRIVFRRRMKRLYLAEIPEEFAFDSHTHYSVSDVMFVLLPRNGVLTKFDS
jgi:hypothetical protein